MKKILKYILLSLAIILSLIVGVAGYLIAAFKPNDYKQQIIQAVKDEQHRTLKLGGDIRLVFFPQIGVSVENISLSEYESDKEFASMESARVSLALLPLLSGRLFVSDVSVNGVKAAVVKFRDGTSSLDDLIGKKEDAGRTLSATEAHPATPIDFDIAEIRIEHAEASYRDESSGEQYFFKDLNMRIGKVANGRPFDIDLEAAIQANKPQLDIVAQLQATFTFDMQENIFRVKDLDMQAKGAVLDVTNFALTATGAASANLNAREFTAKKLNVSINGSKGKDRYSASLSFPVLILGKDKVTAEKLVIDAMLEGEQHKVMASFGMQDMQGNAQSFKSSGLVLDIDYKQPEQEFILKITSPLAASLESGQYNFSNLLLALNATGERFGNKPVANEMKGSMQLDAERESMQLNMVGDLLQSQVKAKLATKGFTEPAIRFDVEADQFDADQYWPIRYIGAETKAGQASEKEFDLSVLKKFNLQGSLRIATFKAANIKASKLRMDMKAANGEVTVSTLSANLYEGSLNSSIAFNAADIAPAFAVKMDLSDVQFGAMLKELFKLDLVQGKGDVAANIVARGNTADALRHGATGSIALNMADGAVNGINLARLLQEAQNPGRAGGVQTIKPVTGEMTEFSELKAGFKLNKNIVRNDDLLVKASSLTVAGKGEIDLGNSSINYSSKASLAVQLDGKSGSVTLPVQLQGIFSDMKFNVDYGAIVTAVDKQKAARKTGPKNQPRKLKVNSKPKKRTNALRK